MATRVMAHAALWRQIRREGLIVLAVLLGVGASMLVLEILTEPDRPRWSGRTAVEWGAKLQSAKPESRDSAIVALSILEPSAPGTIKAAGALLADSSDGVALDAMQTLLDPRDSEPRVLVRVLASASVTLSSSHSTRARAYAARVFGALGTQALTEVPTLTRTIADTSASVRAAVAAALGSILEGVDPQTASRVLDGAVDRLRDALRDSSSVVRDAALEALYRISPDDPRLAPLLAAALHDASADVRERATAMLTLVDRRRARLPNPRP
jgi:HEAT repeat protein